MTSANLLDIYGLCAGYGPTDVLHGVDMTIAPGEIVALLGSNGAGKSTLNRAISGLVRPRAGSIRFEGLPIDRATPSEIVARGLIHVPEGRRIFPNMTVLENLELGSYRRASPQRTQNKDRVFAIFPKLSQRRSQLTAIVAIALARIRADPLARVDLQCCGARAHDLPTFASSVARSTDGIEPTVSRW